MIAQQEEFNPIVNLLMSAKMRNLHHVEYSGLHQLLYPQLGDAAKLLPIGIRKKSMGREHGIVLSVVEIEITILQGWDLSQLTSHYTYSLWNIHGHQCVLKILWDAIAVNCTSQGKDIIR
jgi:hypothetical protein